MKKEIGWKPELPEDLQTENYTYPPDLFQDWDKIMRFDGSEDIHVSIPVNDNEESLLMARYAVANALRLVGDSGKLVAIARAEYEGSYMRGIRKVGRSIISGDLEQGDIELKAEELGVYEIIWPFDPQKMREAIEAEQQLEGSIAA
jgi:hypothetical protein